MVLVIVFSWLQTIIMVIQQGFQNQFSMVFVFKHRWNYIKQSPSLKTFFYLSQTLKLYICFFVFKKWEFAYSTIND